MGGDEKRFGGWYATETAAAKEMVSARELRGAESVRVAYAPERAGKRAWQILVRW